MHSDTAMPGLGLLLDLDALAGRLRAAPGGADLRSAQPTCVRYKPGMNCLVAYKLDVGGTEIEVYAKGHRRPRIRIRILRL